MSDDQVGCEWVNVSSGTSLPGLSLTKAVKRLCVCACACAYVCVCARARVCVLSPCMLSEVVCELQRGHVARQLREGSS